MFSYETHPMEPFNIVYMQIVRTGISLPLSHRPVKEKREVIGSKSWMEAKSYIYKSSFL